MLAQRHLEKAVRIAKYAGRIVMARKVFYKYRESTMIRQRQYVENLVLASLTLQNSAMDGLSIVECGTWKGGMAAGLLEIGGQDRDYHFFDSFEGLPEARQIDGEAALAWQRNTSSVAYYDNCSASLEDFWATVGQSGIDRRRIHAHKGWFKDTVKVFEPPRIAVLRLDGDWYDSTILCLEAFWDAVVPGGLVLIDDYGVWAGCTRATHDFLSSRKSVEPIQQGPIGRVTYIVKRSPEATDYSAP